MKILKQAIDQLGHIAWAYLALLPVLVLGPSAGGIAGSIFLFFIWRELIDQWPIGRWWDTALDLAVPVVIGTTLLVLTVEPYVKPLADWFLYALAGFPR